MMNGIGYRKKQKISGISGRGRSLEVKTYNAKTMFKAGKIHNPIREVEKMKIDIMGEMRWPDAGCCSVGSAKMYYSKTLDNMHQRGARLIVSKSIARHITNFMPVSESVILVQIRGICPVSINITDGTKDVNTYINKKRYRQIPPSNRKQKDITKSDKNTKKSYF